MPGVDLGATTTVSWRLATSGASVVLTVTNPDGTTDTPTVTEATGTYSAAIETAQPGRYLLSWAKAAAPAAAYSDILDVWPADPRFLISLADAKSALRMPANVTTDEEDLRLYIAAATVVIEDIVGVVLLTEQEQYSDGGKTGVALWQRPDRDAPLTVTVAGVLLGDSEYTVDYNAAIVYAGSSTSPTRFPTGRQNIKITYTAGSTVISPNIRLATRELVRHNWQVGQQAHRPAMGNEPDGQSYTPSGFAVPKRVIEWCSATPRLPGMS